MQFKRNANVKQKANKELKQRTIVKQITDQVIQESEEYQTKYNLN